MSLNRIVAVFYKDSMWAMHNPKLLVLVLMPPLIGLLFQFTAKGLLLAFSVVFMFAMIGTFLGSYLITEEKRIESLKNILITPLTTLELSIGKFLLPLVLCVVFALFNFVIAKKISLFFEPSVFAAILLFSCISSLLGLLMGLVVKNEQELGVVAPFFILLFMAGTIATKSSGIAFASYCPEFHLAHLIENYSVLNTFQRSLHVMFLAFELVFVLLIVSAYLRFYFSNDADSKRVNLKTLLFSIPLLLFFGVSGATADYFKLDTKRKDQGTSVFTLKSVNFVVDLNYDDLLWDIQQSKSDKFQTVEMRSKTDNFSVVIALIKLSNDESSFELRQAKYAKDGSFYLNVERPFKDFSQFNHYTYTNGPLYKTSYEYECVDELLRFHFPHPLDATEFKNLNDSVLDLIKAAKVSCIEPPEE